MNTRRVTLYIVLVLAAIAFMDVRLNAIDLATIPYVQVDVNRNGSQMYIGDNTPQGKREGSIAEHLKTGEVLHVVNNFGSIEVQGYAGEDRQEATMDYVITVYADTTEQARSFLKEVELEIRRGDTGVDVGLANLNKIPAYVRAIKVNIKALMPASARVNLENGFGIVRVQDVAGPSEVVNRFGETDVERISGSIDIDAAYSKLTVSGITGDVRVTGDYGSSELNDIDGDLTLQTDFKETRIGSVTGDVMADTRFGDIVAADLGGDVEVHSSHAKIEGSHVKGDVGVKSEYGDVSLENIDKNVRVDAGFSDVVLNLNSPADHRFDLESRFGDISTGTGISGLRSDDTKDNRESLQGTVGSGRYDVRVRTRYGDIRLDVR